MDQKRTSPVLLALFTLFIAVVAFLAGRYVGMREAAMAPETPQTPITAQTPSTPDTPDSPDTPESPQTPDSPTSPTTPDTPDSPDTPASPTTPDTSQEAGLERDGYYYDVENVVLYLELYGELPPNYVTKREARDEGWSGGTPSQVFEGAAIGGDHFSNREGLLPSGDYYEADIDTGGKSKRGAKRLVFTYEGDYYYTSDHYKSFTRLVVEDGEVIWQ